MQNDLSRRKFIETAVAGSAVGTSLLTAPAPARAAGANERIRIGVIGAGNRGFNSLTKSLINLRAKGRNIDLVSGFRVLEGVGDQIVNNFFKMSGINL